ncbi:hypothetical protein [Neptuniibacter sp. QD48_11]|uniref:hypothetical protein n=1 Tax=Neptuniibacter sp. QD48_11 TaxID=3398211 RepID=UPI0039F44B07
MVEKKKTGVQITDNDPDIRLIKNITGDQDLSSFENLMSLIPLIDIEGSNWNAFHYLHDRKIFLEYFEHLWADFKKIIGKPKQNLSAIVDCYSGVIATEEGRKLFGEKLIENIALSRSPDDYPQIREFDEKEYLEGYKLFISQLNKNSADFEKFNVDVFLAESSIFAAEWYYMANQLEKYRTLAKFSHEKATTEIRSYHLAASYIYHLLEQVRKGNSQQVTAQDIHKVMQAYWLIKLARDARAFIKDKEFKPSTKGDRQHLPDTIDDFVIRQLIPENGTSIKNEKNFYRALAIKAWVYTQTKDSPKPPTHLALDLSELEYFINIGRDNIQRRLRDMLEPGYLTKSIPDELREHLVPETA